MTKHSAAEGSLRLILDGDALTANWRALDQRSGSAACGAAVKADGYGVGAREVVGRLAAAGCRDFFVAHWSEALAIADLVPTDQIAVLNGCSPSEVELAKQSGIRPVLNSPGQVAAWKQAGGGTCHVMIDTGINRLGVGPEQLDGDLLAGLDIDIAMTHLASADEDVPQNGEQLERFETARAGLNTRRFSTANSAGIMLGEPYHLDLTRPGLSLYGGIARPEMAQFIQPVVKLQSRILQLRELKAGDPVGYNAKWLCPEDMPVATICLGYADGYLRSFFGKGVAHHDGAKLPAIGRISMDLVTLDARGAKGLEEGDWVQIDYDLARASAQSGLSQYELLTGLGQRFDRVWQ